MKTVAIAGASGFVGQNLIKYLEKREEHQLKLISHQQLEEDLADYLRDVTVIINLIGHFSLPSVDQMAGNVLPLARLAEVAVKNNIIKIIHISATAAYGLPDKGYQFKETDPLHPDTSYGLAKKMTEEVAEYYHQQHGLHFTILRPPNIYGPGTTKGVIYSLIKSVQEKGEVTLHGKGDQERDFLYVDDLCSAIEKCLDRDDDFEIFNITNGQVYTLLQVVEKLEKIMEKTIEKKFEGEAQGGSIICGDNQKAQTLLNWSPEVDLEQGLRRTIEAML